MREILFRGKRIDNGEWIEGSVFKWLNAKYILTSSVDTCAKTSFEVVTETIGAYTGLTDKNGTKIFEGDILKGAWGTLIKVYFDECYLQFRAKEFTHRTIDHSIDYYGDNSRLEVVGNVYDNPELLEKRCEK